ncbi:MAG: hypothetical protein MUC60_08970 [Oscillatoria sp. Prado101]|nr:hypothetical protein [Oscillatoria sp. Prado101]
MWAKLVGISPDSKIQYPTLAGYQERGGFQEGNLILNVQPTRLDWVFTLVGERELTVPLFSKKSFPDSLSSFLKLMLPWLETSPPILRLAFGTSLVQPLENKQAVCQQISAYLPWAQQLDIENGSDFLYKINRPNESASGISGMKINRLSQWSAITWKKFLRIQDEELLGRGKIRPSLSYWACRLELDINTALDFEDEIPGKQLAQLFQELVDMGKEIATEGDIR